MTPSGPRPRRFVVRCVTGRRRCGSGAPLCARRRRRPSASSPSDRRLTDPHGEEFVAALLPLLHRDAVADVVFPHAVDLEEPLRDTFLADAQFLHHPSTVGVARHDADLEPVQVQFVEREPDENQHALGDVPVAGPRLVDPVADGAALHGPAADGVEIDLAGEEVVDEQPEAVRETGVALAVACRAPCAEGVARPSRVGQAGEPGRFPRHQPVLVAHADLRPLREVGGGERTQHHPLAVETQTRRRRQRGVPGAAHRLTVTSASWRRRITPTTAQHAATTVSTMSAGRPGLSRRSLAASVARVRNTSSAAARSSTNGKGGSPPCSTAATASANAPRRCTAAPSRSGRSMTRSSMWSATEPMALVSSSGRGGSLTRC